MTNEWFWEDRDIVLMRRLRWWLSREMKRYQPSGLWLCGPLPWRRRLPKLFPRGQTTTNWRTGHCPEANECISYRVLYRLWWCPSPKMGFIHPVSSPEYDTGWGLNPAMRLDAVRFHWPLDWSEKIYPEAQCRHGGSIMGSVNMETGPRLNIGGEEKLSHWGQGKYWLIGV